MKNQWRCMWCVAWAAGWCAAALGQGTKADYERAAKLQQATANKVTGLVESLTWIGPDRLWYSVDLGGGKRRYERVNAATGVKGPLFDAPRLATLLREKLGATVDPEALPIERVHVSDDGIDLLFRDQARAFRLTDTLAELPIEGATAFLLSPDRGTRRGRSSAIIVANRTEGEVELFYVSGEERRSYGKVGAGQVKRQHTFGGHRWAFVDATGATLREIAAADEPGVVLLSGLDKEGVPPAPEPDRPRRGRRGQGGRSPDGSKRIELRGGNVILVDAQSQTERALTTDGTDEAGYQGEVVWSPDSTRFVVRWVMPAQAHPVHMVESSPRDQVQPRLKTIDYLKPGDRIETRMPRLFDAGSGSIVPVSEELFATPWSIDELAWAADSSSFSFVYNQRGHRVLRLVGVDAKTGVAKTIVEETPETFVDYVNSVYLRRLEKTGEVLWMSERDGWRHLYLIDAAAGTVKNQITKGPWVVREVTHVDEEARRVWFTAGGIHPGQDPYYLHAAAVNFDGTGLTVFTAGDGTHDVEFSSDRAYLVDRYSRVDMPGVAELRRTADGGLVCELARADWSALVATGWRPPERFAAKGRDGVTDIYGIIVTPTNFDGATRYPVIEQIYAGPHSAFVPKAFDAHLGTMQNLAELGFVVVMIDGMGTAHRSRVFHDVAWKNLGDSGFPDRIAWMRAAAETRPWMDLSRVGIYGGSAGGQNAMRALIDHHDFYKAAVADCGCHDNRMDKIWWNELWMSWPVGPEYEAASNVAQAGKMEGKLLLVVGELDTNVDPASTMQVVNALIKADKDFELLMIPGSNHGAAESPYGRRRRADFFVRNLLGVEPRRE